MDPDSKRLRIAVTDGRGRPVRAGALARWLARIAPARARGEVTIALASDAQVRALNRKYRRKDKATDVLSFPSDAPNHERRTTNHGTRQLGDIVIATGVARRQAREAGHSYDTELRVLALHGLLHLLGYDHETPGDKGRMSRLEARLHRAGGISQGLIERSHQRLRPARAAGLPAVALNVPGPPSPRLRRAAFAGRSAKAGGKRRAAHPNAQACALGTPAAAPASAKTGVAERGWGPATAKR